MKVYFDLDAVLADFDRGVSELCHMQTPRQGGVSAADDDAMWAAIRDVEHFYDRLELMPGGKELFDYAYSRLGPDCQILSGIPKPRRGILTAGEDKTSWCHRLLHPNVKVNIVYREQKKNFCTGPNCILVDDLESNIRDWRSFGGTGILHKDAKTSLEQLQRILG